MSITNKVDITCGGHGKDGPSLLYPGGDLNVSTSTVLYFCVILLVLVVFPGICNSEEATTVWPSALVITTSADASAIAPLEEIIEESVVIELQRNNLRVVMPSEDLLQTTAPDSPIELDSFLDDMVASAETNFVVVCLYGKHQDRIRIDFRWYDVQSKTLATELAIEARIDLDLDTTIRKALTEILDQNRERIQNLARTVVVDTSTETDKQMQEGTEKPLFPAWKAEALEKHEKKRIEVSLGFSPFITTGNASEYFKVGLMPGLSGSYRIPLANSTIGIGLVAGYNGFPAEGTDATSQNSLIPVGLDVKYWMGGKFPVGPFVRLAGGPAVFTVVVETLGIFTKLVFFATGGIGFRIPLSQTFGMNLEASYTIFFDRPIAITGFTPSIYLYARF